MRAADYGCCQYRIWSSVHSHDRPDIVSRYDISRVEILTQVSSEQRSILHVTLMSWDNMQSQPCNYCQTADSVHRHQYFVCISRDILSFYHANTYIQRLCLAIIIGFPAATPTTFKNSAGYAFGNFTNSTHTNQLTINDSNMNPDLSIWVVQWICFHPKFPLSSVGSWRIRLDGTYQ